ncbi:uncharacterized protein TEOVI_000795900 [Trypanosoma equiperdum]|uniref:Uncharacterized protein n=1 Tax=Trypanosoma equiperdum TaxID=5694 RepID=A0A1G4I828_TRYEQ|nr:hypothetical protein, conserved [Trypanosoma equiperdum]
MEGLSPPETDECAKPHNRECNTTPSSGSPPSNIPPQQLLCSVRSGIHSNLTESAWESRESNSGYAHEKQSGVDGDACTRYYQRLHRFYEQYNPKNLSRISEYLAAYKGKEEQLMAILVGKYGPEPVDRGPQTNLSCCSGDDSVMHFSGKRYRIPTVVTPQQGNTDCETPYWGNSPLIGERDILGLLSSLETANVELQKCYIGPSAQHPTSSWNGMTYVTRAEIFTPNEETFLGHKWTFTLGSKKVLVHEGSAYHRATFFCTDECQYRGRHERWRLCVYTSSVDSLYLVRVIWDPVVYLEPLPLDRSALSQHSSSEAMPIAGSSVSYQTSCGKGNTEPEQPLISATMINIMTMLENMDKKISGRFDALEARFSFLESKLLGAVDDKQRTEDR